MSVLEPRGIKRAREDLEHLQKKKNLKQHLGENSWDYAWMYVLAWHAPNSC
jgi:hypothetical protein